MNDPTAKTTAEWPGIEEAAGLLNFRIGAWQDFGYVTPPTPDCKAIPPLGERSAEAIKAGHGAIEVIDEIVRDLYQVREQLLGELRTDEDIRAVRVDAMLAEARHGRGGAGGPGATGRGHRAPRRLPWLAPADRPPAGRGRGARGGRVTDGPGDHRQDHAHRHDAAHRRAPPLEAGDAWRVSWFPRRLMDRNAAITAMTLAEQIDRNGLWDYRNSANIDAWAAELGLTGPRAIEMIGSLPQQDAQAGQ